VGEVTTVRNPSIALHTGNLQLIEESQDTTIRNAVGLAPINRQVFLVKRSDDSEVTY
jgi:hypothetical protein